MANTDALKQEIAELKKAFEKLAADYKLLVIQKEYDDYVKYMKCSTNYFIQQVENKFIKAKDDSIRQLVLEDLRLINDVLKDPSAEKLQKCYELAKARNEKNSLLWLGLSLTLVPSAFLVYFLLCGFGIHLVAGIMLTATLPVVLVLLTVATCLPIIPFALVLTEALFAADYAEKPSAYSGAMTTILKDYEDTLNFFQSANTTNEASTSGAETNVGSPFALPAM